ncbi:MAG TPA: DUF2569 family protein [Candidatus Angelobacter sp.]|nr:DUF2569 family protein [Candidatus Angelobacter sp.]
MLQALRILYGAVMGVILWTGRAIALRMLRVYFIAVAVTLALSTLQMIAVSLRAHESIFLSDNFTATFSPIGFAILWFAYFRKSVRVRNTYGANL